MGSKGHACLKCWKYCQITLANDGHLPTLLRSWLPLHFYFLLVCCVILQIQEVERITPCDINNTVGGLLSSPQLYCSFFLYFLCLMFLYMYHIYILLLHTYRLMLVNVFSVLKFHIRIPCPFCVNFFNSEFVWSIGDCNLLLVLFCKSLFMPPGA